MFSSYEPELFPGLIYRMIKPKIVLLIFVSGKIVLTGAKVREEIYQAFEMIYPVLQGMEYSSHVTGRSTDVDRFPQSLIHHPAVFSTQIDHCTIIPTTQSACTLYLYTVLTALRPFISPLSTAQASSATMAAHRAHSHPLAVLSTPYLITTLACKREGVYILHPTQRAFCDFNIHSSTLLESRTAVFVRWSVDTAEV